MSNAPVFLLKRQVTEYGPGRELVRRARTQRTMSTSSQALVLLVCCPPAGSHYSHRYLAFHFVIFIHCG